MCRRTGGGPESKRGERDWPHAIFSQFWLMYCLSAAKSGIFFSVDLCLCFAPYSILVNPGSSFPIERSSSSSSSLRRIAASATIKAGGGRAKNKREKETPAAKSRTRRRLEISFSSVRTPPPSLSKKKASWHLEPRCAPS